MKKKRRHHYVWQHYLSSWTNDEQLWCLREGTKLFKTSTQNVAQARDFYRIQKMNKNEIDLVHRVFIEPMGKLGKELNSDWISLMQSIHKLDQLIKERGANEAWQRKIDIYINNMEEDLHSFIESESESYIQMLRESDLSFFNEEKDRVAFLFYLAIQYVRTNRMKQSLLMAIGNDERLHKQNISIENCWGVIKIITATNLAHSLISKNYKPVILTAPPDKSFITGDQPAINLFSDGVSVPNKVDLYYPISPRVSLLYTQDEKMAQSSPRALSPEHVELLNQKIYDLSYEQVYSDCEESLQRLSETNP